MANFLDKYFGRLGNRLFQTAFLYAYAKENGIDYYFQNPKWFERYALDIQKLFGEGIGYDDRVSIHIRRGTNPSNPDEPAYSENPFVVNLSNTNYYSQAMARFPKDRFLIFSDDIDWCIKQKIFADCDFRKGYSEEEDLKLMASCKHNIIANSSFSWWAAWLNPNPDKIVIAPKAWYGDGDNSRTILPANWIRI